MHEDTRGVPAELGSPRSVEVVPQVVYVDEPMTVFSANGLPQMSTHRVPHTRSVAFAPADYARYLRRWSASNMPAEPQAGVSGQTYVVIGLVLIVAALGMAASGLQSQSPGLLVAAFLCGVTGYAVISDLSDSGRERRRAPGRAMSQSAAWSRGEAYVALEHGHFGRAAALSDQVECAQRIAEQQRESAWHSAQQARRTDEQYWTNLAGWPAAQQWQAADAFRESIASEWARRVGGQVVADVSLVPSYDEVVAWLRWTPSAW